MSGGSKSQTTTTPGATPAATPAAGSNMMTLPGAMPGQLEQISQQLAGGFGMPQQDILAQLQQLHKPMQVQDPSQAWKPAGGAAAAPAQPQTINGRPTLDKNGRTYMWTGTGYVPMGGW